VKIAVANENGYQNEKLKAARKAQKRNGENNKMGGVSKKAENI